jgi:HD-GYP domain-containing protein (c-di-GMP phosphodiesterase class II)
MKFERIGNEAAHNSIRLADLVRAFSYALDLTEGQPAGHCVRSCWIGCNIGRALGLTAHELTDLYYALLLKDLGCSSNAARICELYGADDRAFKRGFKTAGTSLAATLVFVARNSAPGQSLRRRSTTVGNILKNGVAIADEMILSRCTRGSEIAHTLGFSSAVEQGIYHLDEHWDGSGRPEHLRGEAIPLISQIALIAQVADVFHTHAGRAASTAEVARRAGAWFDPKLAGIFLELAKSDQLWEHLKSPFLDARLTTLLPADECRPADDDFLDAIATAFGQVIDAKSPYTADHSARVGDLAMRVADAMDVPLSRRRGLYRAAVLHDVGKLGVSNAILDKPGPLNAQEWEEMRGHASHTFAILDRIGPLREMAAIAAGHHERLDGRGYPSGLPDELIRRETRIITVCDFYDALSSTRPYRHALGPEEALAIMNEAVGSALDPDCFEAMRTVLS